jgi:hypothetical protein
MSTFKRAAPGVKFRSEQTHVDMTKPLQFDRPTHDPITGQQTSDDCWNVRHGKCKDESCRCWCHKRNRDNGSDKNLTVTGYPGE